MEQVKYIAQLKNVRELVLMGEADLSWWREHLADEELEPTELDGRAQVFLTGLDTKWMGLPFRDVSVAVAAHRSDGSDEAGLFFARAFNASRFFAGVERRWFDLPYSYCSDLHVELAESGTICLGRQSGADVVAEMDRREDGGEAQEMEFTGPLFLPRGRNRSRWLMVQIRGMTSTIDFDPERDRFEVGSDCVDPVIAGLIASDFCPIQWHVRRSSTHARTKTFETRR